MIRATTPFTLWCGLALALPVMTTAVSAADATAVAQKSEQVATDKRELSLSEAFEANEPTSALPFPEFADLEPRPDPDPLVFLDGKPVKTAADWPWMGGPQPTRSVSDPSFDSSRLAPKVVWRLKLAGDGGPGPDRRT